MLNTYALENKDVFDGIDLLNAQIFCEQSRTSYFSALCGSIKSGDDTSTKMRTLYKYKNLACILLMYFRNRLQMFFVN